ncbi:uncharacterized protein LOC126895560 [Daktulosphaira vitifoliae]|uniref:uncharacterized protein LOC126895560 n=1 Tax=Daktulosphaira vitifoliae TaxID=58002 RepID=UPI0021AAC4C8|nr:uncharacterized protein LOC126895560 [Daktulosphaira vitifoliae]
MAAKLVLIVCMALFAVCFALPAVPENVAVDEAVNDVAKPVVDQPKENMKTADTTFLTYGYYPSYGYAYPKYYSGLGYRSIPYYYDSYYSGIYKSYPYFFF